MTRKGRLVLIQSWVPIQTAKRFDAAGAMLSQSAAVTEAIERWSK